MTVLAVADLFAIHGRRDELLVLLEHTEQQVRAQPGCRRYAFATTVADPDRLLLVGEWDSQADLDAHYASEAFRTYQFGLDGLLARPTEMAHHTVRSTVHPVGGGPMDPRDAD